MTAEAHLDKFRQNCADATRALPEDKSDALIESVGRLEAMPNVGQLIDLSVA